jgi:hypothetical protein
MDGIDDEFPVLDVEELFSAFVENAVWMGEIELSYSAFRKLINEFYQDYEETPIVIQTVETNIGTFMDIFDGVVHRCFA